MNIDSIDAKILEALQRDGRASHSAIAEQVGLSQPSVHERIKKLEQRGVIRGYTTIVDPEALDLGVLAFISARFNRYETEGVTSALMDVPNVLEVHHIAGEDCLMVKVRCHAPADLEHILERIWKSGPISGTKTTIAFSTYKETMVLPVEGCLPEAEVASV